MLTMDFCERKTQRGCMQKLKNIYEASKARMLVTIFSSVKIIISEFLHEKLQKEKERKEREIKLVISALV